MRGAAPGSIRAWTATAPGASVAAARARAVRVFPGLAGRAPLLLAIGVLLAGSGAAAIPDEPAPTSAPPSEVDRSPPATLHPAAVPTTDEIPSHGRWADGADGAALRRAIRRSLHWLDSPAAARWYPRRGGGPDGADLTRADVRASLERLEALLDVVAAEDSLLAAVAGQLDAHEAVARRAPGSTSAAARSGRMRMTAYFGPELDARLAPDERFRVPLHGPPPEVPSVIGGGSRSDPVYATREEIEREGLLDGREVAWLEDELDAYLVGVNGSARLRLDDGSTRCAAHCGTNGHTYSSLGRLLIEAGHGSVETMTLDVIRERWRTDPDLVRSLMRRNDRYPFFELVPCDEWPRSSLGIPLTAGRSVAVDPRLVPPGAAVLVQTTLDDGAPLVRIMLAQDTGGAIRGARADLYVGAGAAAGRRAGVLHADGSILVLLAPEPGGVVAPTLDSTGHPDEPHAAPDGTAR